VPRVRRELLPLDLAVLGVDFELTT
jgi:hypothetical protein